VSADGDGDVVVVDAAHGNRIDRAALYPLTSAVTRAGGSVRFHSDGDLNESLEGADAFVVVDPQTEYGADDLEAVEQFTDEGGRLLLAAEPDRKTVSGGFFGTTIGTTESSMTAIGSAYGFSFDTAFLYNVGANEGNYEHVTVESSTIEGLDRGAVYTAAAVESAEGRDVLVTAPDTRRYGTDQEGRFAVAVRSGDVLALGDSSLLATDRASVADNEAVVGYVVDFLLSSERAEVDSYRVRVYRAGGVTRFISRANYLASTAPDERKEMVSSERYAPTEGGVPTFVMLHGASSGTETATVSAREVTANGTGPAPSAEPAVPATPRGGGYAPA
jgi:hypothetical protein